MMAIGGAIAGGSRLAMASHVRPVDVLGRGPPLRRHRRVLHVDAAARPRRGAAAARASATTRCACSSARACRAGCGAGSRARFKPARVLEFYASTEAGAILVNLRGVKPGLDGPAAARQRRGEDRGLRHRRGAPGARAATASRASARVDEVGMLLARVQPERAAEHDAAAGRVRARGRMARHRRPVPPRRRRRLLARRQRQRRDPHAPRGPSSPARSATPSATSRRSIWRWPTACFRPAASTRSRWPR